MSDTSTNADNPINQAGVVPADQQRKAAQHALRERIWADLRTVASPDARFHWDFSSFIPDFVGSAGCVEQIRRLESYQRAPLLFITPDNSLIGMREAAMADGKPFLMTTHGICRGFMLLEPARVPDAQRPFAATLDGIERFARFLSLQQVQQLGHIEMLITGSSAITVSGVRFGKGHGYFDLEWAMLSDIGSITPQSEIVAVGHDCQVTTEEVPASSFDTIVDWIVTPTRSLRTAVEGRTPGTVYWDRLSPELLATVPVLEELRALLAVR